MKASRNTVGSSPLGAAVCHGGVNFSVFSRNASAVELLFFDRTKNARPARVVAIDPIINRTYHYWHVFVPDVEPGQTYGYRVRGPCEPARGMRFDSSKVLLDPYGRGVVVPANYGREAVVEKGDTPMAMKSVVVDSSRYDWEGDAPLRRPSSRSIVFEMHVRGFTCHPSSGVAEKTRGTFRGLIEKIRYLQQLGITAAELLPYSNSTPRIVRRGGSTTVATLQSRSSHPIRHIAHVRTRWPHLKSFATWSRHYTAPASRSFSTLCSTIPPRAPRADPL